jgi:hypothetical protein
MAYGGQRVHVSFSIASGYIIANLKPHQIIEELER